MGGGGGGGVETLQSERVEEGASDVEEFGGAGLVRGEGVHEVWRVPDVIGGDGAGGEVGLD